MAKRITEPRRTPGEIRAKVMTMLDGAHRSLDRNPGNSHVRGAVWELERLLRWIDGDEDDPWNDKSTPLRP